MQDGPALMAAPGTFLLTDEKLQMCCEAEVSPLIAA